MWQNQGACLKPTRSSLGLRGHRQEVSVGGVGLQVQGRVGPSAQVRPRLRTEEESRRGAGLQRRLRSSAWL